MRRERKALSLFLVFALLLNLLLPISPASANTEENDTSVTGDAYGNSPEQTEEEQAPSFGLLGGIMPLAIPENDISKTTNLITSVQIYDKMNPNGTLPADAKKIQDIRLDIRNEVAVYLEWGFPAGHTFTAGDTFTFQLPNEFATGVALPRPGDPNDLAGEDGPVGTFSVSASGEVVFTFNNEITGKAITGDFFVWRKFDESKLGDSTKHEIEFDIEDIDPILVHFQNTGGKTIEKSGTPKQGASDAKNDRNPDRIEWVVDFNLGEESVTGAEFKDTLPTGLTIDSTSIKIYELNVKLNGDVDEGDEVTDTTITSSVSVVGQVLTINFGAIDTAYRVKYTTSVPKPTSAPYTLQYSNNVEVTGTPLTPIPTKFPLKKKADVDVKFNEPLKKSSTNYDRDKQEVEWTIEYNYNQQTIPAGNAWLKDTFGVKDKNDPDVIDKTHSKLVDKAGGPSGKDFTVYTVEINDKGEATNQQEVTTGYTLTIHDSPTELTNPNLPSFTLQFNNQISSAYKIVYKTTPNDRVQDSQTVVNQAEMVDGIKTPVITREIGQEVFKKDSGSINYDTKKITWTIHLNRDKYEMDDVVITDNFAGQGLTLDDGTFAISGLTKGTDYTLEPYNNSLANPTYEQGFKVTFNNKIEDYHTITYVTDFDPTYFDNYPPVTPKTKKYENRAEIEWTGMPVDFAKTQKGEVTPNEYLQNNGGKSGSYDPTIDSNTGKPVKQITWTLDVNYNRHEIEKAVVRDFYTAGQKFVPGSLEVYELTVVPDGSDTNRNYVTRNPSVAKLTEGADYTVNYNVTHDGTADGKKGFQLNQFHNSLLKKCS